MSTNSTGASCSSWWARSSYGLVLKLLGVYISVFILVLISSLASHEFSLKVAVANGIFLVVFTYLAFIKGLGLIFPLWPSFLGMN